MEVAMYFLRAVFVEWTLTNNCCLADIVSVEPTYSYYERVSEEMQKIVHEVKEKEEVLTNGKIWQC